MLYSFRQQRPAPLPNRIRLSNGFTRYAHQPPTAEEILDAGYIAYTEPAYDPATEQLLWVDGAYVIEALPPPIPTPRWVDFSAIVMSLPAINIMLGAVLQAAPGLYGGLVVGLQNASEGDSRVFLNSWNAAFAMGLLSAELIVTVQELPPSTTCQKRLLRRWNQHNKTLQTSMIYPSTSSTLCESSFSRYLSHTAHCCI
jgi:hypothetical protein